MEQVQNGINNIGVNEIKKAGEFLGGIADVILKNEVSKNQALCLLGAGALATVALLATQLQ